MIANIIHPNNQPEKTSLHSFQESIGDNGFEDTALCGLLNEVEKDRASARKRIDDAADKRRDRVDIYLIKPRAEIETSWSKALDTWRAYTLTSVLTRWFAISAALCAMVFFLVEDGTYGVHGNALVLLTFAPAVVATVREWWSRDFLYRFALEDFSSANRESFRETFGIGETAIYRSLDGQANVTDYEDIEDVTVHGQANAWRVAIDTCGVSFRTLLPTVGNGERLDTERLATEIRRRIAADHRRGFTRT